MSINKSLPPLCVNNLLENKVQPNQRTDQKLSDKPPLKQHARRIGASSGLGKRKENVTILDTLKSINQIIIDCDETINDNDSSYKESKRRNSSSKTLKGSLNTTASDERHCYRGNSHNYGKHSKMDESNFVGRKISMNSINKKSIKITGEISGITNDQLKKLYESKCKDLKRQVTNEQLRRFIEYCTKVIKNRKLVLSEVWFELISSAD